MRYGTFIDNRLQPAPRAIRIGAGVVCNPTDAQYEQAGYKRVIDSPPQTDAEHYAVPTGWTRDGETLRRVYEVREVQPPPPRRWTRLTIKGALADAHLLPAARTFLAAYEIKPDYPALEAFSDCDYVEEGYPNAARWSALLDGAARALGKTREEIDAFMDSIPTE